MKTHLPETLICNDFKNPFSKGISIRRVFLMILNIFTTENNRGSKTKIATLLSLCHISSTKDCDIYLKIVDNRYFAWENDHPVIKESDTVPKAPLPEASECDRSMHRLSSNILLYLKYDIETKE